ncbi:MAG: hypothetical protein K8R68_09845 [Bacteroidales bacterium]|nr:hypothetical protein [Bacteroidales bacterium]
MINNENSTDDFLKGLIQKSDIERPSKSFIQNVMKEIEKFPVQDSIHNSLFARFNYWFIVAISGLFAIAYLIYYFINSENSIISGKFNPVILPVMKKIVLNFKQLFDSIQISSFTVIIIVAIFSLFLIDGFLKKFRAGNRFYFSL